MAGNVGYIVEVGIMMVCSAGLMGEVGMGVSGTVFFVGVRWG